MITLVRRNNLRQEYLAKTEEVKNARIFLDNFQKTIKNEVVLSMDKNEADSTKQKFVDKGERIRHRSTSNSVLSRV